MENSNRFILEKDPRDYCRKRMALGVYRAFDIETVRDLVRLTRSDILKVRNVGKCTLFVIEEFLETYGLKLNMCDAEIAAYEGTEQTSDRNITVNNEDYWEQRRYEITRDVLSAYAMVEANRLHENIAYFTAKAVEAADALITQLKKTK